MKNDNTIEQQMELLDKKLAWFQSDEFSLDEAAERFEEVNALSQEIEDRLSEKKNEIEVLKQKFDA